MEYMAGDGHLGAFICLFLGAEHSEWMDDGILYAFFVET
jgi:hypothetical protein